MLGFIWLGGRGGGGGGERGKIKCGGGIVYGAI